MSEEKLSPTKITAIIFVIAVFVGCQSNNYPETTNKNEQRATKPPETEKLKAPVFDPNKEGHLILQADIRKRIGKPSGEITLDDMSKLNAIHVGDLRKVTDLTPIKGAINLLDLDIYNNPVSDLSPVAGMKKLRKLWAHEIQISDLTPLAELTSLERLHLRGCRITDLSPLTNLKQLKELWIENNPKLTRVQIDKLQKALPNCKINHNAKE